MSNFKAHLKVGKLPQGATFAPSEYLPLLMQRLRMYVSGSDLITGSLNEEPKSDIGPWLKNGNTWYVWSDVNAAYCPSRLGFPATVGGLSITGLPTADRTAKFADKSGTVALTSDAWFPRPTVTVDDVNPVIDYDISSNFFLTLPSTDFKLTGSFLNIPDGKSIELTVVNAGTDYTILWPDKFLFENGTAVQPAVAVSGEIAITQFRITHLYISTSLIQGSIWCEKVATFSGSDATPTSTVPVIPAPVNPFPHTYDPVDRTPYNTP